MKLCSVTKLLFMRLFSVMIVIYAPTVSAADHSKHEAFQKEQNINILQGDWREYPAVGLKGKGLFTLNETGAPGYSGGAAFYPDVFNPLMSNVRELNSGVSARVLFDETHITQSEVPLPAAIWLFGSAVIGFVLFSSRRKV